MTNKLEIGKTYRRRDGGVERITSICDDPDYQFRSAFDKTYTSEGRFNVYFHETDYDLLFPAIEDEKPANHHIDAKFQGVIGDPPPMIPFSISKTSQTEPSPVDPSKPMRVKETKESVYLGSSHIEFGYNVIVIPSTHKSFLFNPANGRAVRGGEPDILIENYEPEEVKAKRYFSREQTVFESASKRDTISYWDFETKEQAEAVARVLNEIGEKK